MSEQITHLAVSDDAQRLALASPRICAYFKHVLAEQRDTMRLGAVTRSSEKFAGPLIGRLRDRADAPGPQDARKLAFCLGTLAHRAADRMLKPVFRAQTADGRYNRKDISIYHDVFLFGRVFANGREHPYTPDALAVPLPPPAGCSMDMQTAETLYRVLFQRALLSAHTFKPDTDDTEGWLERVFEQLQNMTIDLARYHRALTDPDPELRRRALEQVNFYNDGDAILALLDDLRAGRAVDGQAFLARCRLGDAASLYARAVSHSYGYIHAASEFWQHQASETYFLDAITR